MEHIELAIGPVDGANNNFATAEPYVPGSLVVMPNGRASHAGDDDRGWEETGPDTFRVSSPPQPGDRVFIRYVEAA